MFGARLWFARVLQAVLYRGVPPLKPSDDRLFVSAGEKDKGYDGFFLPVSLYESCSSDWMSNMMTSYITLVIGGAHISNDGIDSLFFMVFRRQHHDFQVFRKPEKMSCYASERMLLSCCKGRASTCWTALTHCDSILRITSQTVESVLEAS
jgi:hypothetical protein